MSRAGLARTAAALRSSLLAAFGAALALGSPAVARSLESVIERGTLGLCAHPNGLPFSSRKAEPPGFQIELGRAIAQRLGVSMSPTWIVSPFQIRRADCDLVLDTIADPKAQAESGLTLSKPYYRTGIMFAVRSESPITSFASLDATTRVAVQAGSLTAMMLNKRGVPTSSFGFESDMLDAVAQQEVDAAAVTPTSAGYYNVTHPDQPLRLVGPEATEPDLSWNVSVGMVKPDQQLKRAIDEALEALSADGTIAGIYASYGVALQPAK